MTKEKSYWTTADEEYPVNKVTVYGVDYAQHRLREYYRSKLSKVVKGQNIMVLVYLLQGTFRTRSFQQNNITGWVDDCIVDNALWSDKQHIFTVVDDFVENKKCLYFCTEVLLSNSCS